MWLKIVCLMFWAASSMAALNPVQLRFIQLFTYGTPLDFHGRLQTVTETTDTGTQAIQKQVYAFDPKGRLVRVFHYQNKRYIALTKIRYKGASPFPKTLSVYDRVRKTRLQYHFKFNPALTQASQYRVLDAQTVLVKVARLQAQEVVIQGGQGIKSWQHTYALSKQGDVLAKRISTQDQKLTERYHYNAARQIDSVMLLQGTHWLPHNQITYQLDGQKNWIEQRWYDARQKKIKTVKRAFIYLTPFGYCGAPTNRRLSAKKGVQAGYKVDVGTLHNRQYDNPYFQFRLTLPQPYAVLQDDDRFSLMLAKAELNVEIQNDVKQTLDASALDFLTLFHVESGQSSLLAVAEKMTRYPGANTGFDVLCQLKQQIKEAKTPLFFINAPYTTQVGGKPFFTNDVWVGSRNKPTAEKKYFVRAIKGYAVLFSYTRALDEASPLLSLLQDIEFYEKTDIWDFIQDVQDKIGL